MRTVFIVTIRTFLFLFAILVGTPAYAQITSNAFYTEPTQYGGGETEDPIFFYSDITTAVLTAPGGVSYQWYKYSSTNTFEPIAGATASYFDNVSESGYRVEVEAADGNKTNYYCWNFVPLMQIDSIGTTPAKNACNNLRLTAYVSKPLIYYNHYRSDTPAFEVDYGYSWSSTPTGPIEGQTGQSHMIDAPLVDTDYFVIVGNKFSPTLTPAEIALEYTAIAVEAKYSFETEGVADNEATEGSAPMIVRFTDESLGKITDWEWTFGDAGKDFVSDPIFTFQKFAEDGYPVVLIVRNLDAGCESETDAEVFTVKEMVIKAPNAFTPFSSPGDNDQFRVYYRSVNKFNMVIYNRWGRKVYHSSNPDVGWDGHIGSRRAEPGVYFFKVEAEGFNPGEREKLEGAVHLIVN